MTDLIPRDAAIAAITIGHTVTHPDPACDHCGMNPAAIREAALREAAAKCADHAEAARKKLGASETREEANAWALIVTRCDLLEEAIIALIGEKK